MYGLFGLLSTSGENFMSTAPLEIYLLRKMVTCSMLILPAVQTHSRAMHPRHWKHCAKWSESSSCPVAHRGTCRRREVCPEKASQFLQSTASSRKTSSEETERLRVFISGTTQLATVETKTSSTAMRASSTLMSLPMRVRAVAFSRPSS